MVRGLYNKLRDGAGLRRSKAKWLSVGLAVGQDVVASGYGRVGVDSKKIIIKK